jgi:hypothetical protein
VGFTATLVDQKGHDGFWNDVGNILFHQVEIRLDKVLDHTGLHDHTAALLVSVGSHLVRNLRKSNEWEVGSIEQELLVLLYVLDMSLYHFEVIMSSLLCSSFMFMPLFSINNHGRCD